MKIALIGASGFIGSRLLTELTRRGRRSSPGCGRWRSPISAEDYAVAMVDELEKPAHSRQRFTVGY